MTSNTDHKLASLVPRRKSGYETKMHCEQPATPVFLQEASYNIYYTCMYNYYITKMLQLLGLLVTAAGLLSPCMAETFHVAPTLPATDCPKPCHTLDQYARSGNLSHYSNITLIFLEGVHILSSDLGIETRIIILQPALPNQGQPPKVIGQYVTVNARFEIRALNVSIEGLLFEKLQLSINEKEKENYKIEGFTVTIRQCGVFTGGLLIRNEHKNRNDGVDRSIAITNLTISHCQTIYIWAVKKLLIENSVVNVSGLYINGIPNVTIVNSKVSHASDFGISAINSNITLRNSQIDSNDFGVVLSSTRYELFNEFDNSSFTQNRLFGIWVLNFNRGKTIFKNCIFDSNSGTPIVGYQSTFQLSGENVFSNNTVVRGGGLALYQSTVSFDSGSTTRFENNTALEYGGGIYIATDPPLLPQILVALENSKTFDDAFQPCFYHGDKDGNTHVEFSGNNAGFGGRDIFGLTAASYHA